MPATCSVAGDRPASDTELKHALTPDASDTELKHALKACFSLENEDCKTGAGRLTKAGGRRVVRVVRPLRFDRPASY
jgi:hypothetical protein